MSGENAAQLLTGLLHYHERATLAQQDGGACGTPIDGKCPSVVFIDLYAEALREAIRCVRLVHGLGP